MTAVQRTEEFLDHIFAGRMDAALAQVAPDARLIAMRPDPSPSNPLFGTHIGPAGAAKLFSEFGALIAPGEFTVTGKFGDQNQACLFGTFQHHVRSTGRPFHSDWALVTQWRDGLMTLYHMYEDTAALAEAALPAS